ncbi:MAG: response regulator [Thermodesulfovibrionales bacterium]
MKKVLFVDDSSIMRLFARMSTRSIHGISMTEAQDGHEAIEKLEKEPFDLIITDINMPRMDGLQLIRHVRMMGLKFPIIILTTCGEEKDVETGIFLGADDYVTKPITSQKLTMLISNYTNVPAPLNS